MRKLILVASVALLAQAHDAGAATPCDSISVFRCTWNFHGDYVLRGFEALTVPGLQPVVDGPPKGTLCISVISELEGLGCAISDGFPLSNATGETYLMGPDQK